MCQDHPGGGPKGWGWESNRDRWSLGTGLSTECWAPQKSCSVTKIKDKNSSRWPGKEARKSHSRPRARWITHKNCSLQTRASQKSLFLWWRNVQLRRTGKRVPRRPRGSRRQQADTRPARMQTHQPARLGPRCSRGKPAWAKKLMAKFWTPQETSHREGRSTNATNRKSCCSRNGGNRMIWSTVRRGTSDSKGEERTDTKSWNRVVLEGKRVRRLGEEGAPSVKNRSLE